MANSEINGNGGLALLTVTEAANKLDAGEITSEALVRDCLARIKIREPEIGAWAYIDPDYAMEQARARDAEPRRSALHGVPIGIKDIIDTMDMPTGHGSSIYTGDRPGRDSACVAAFRAAGMVVLGKTVTTEFASPYPVGTRNPHDIERTPGVSSSGSGAAVADFHVPCANGTQTGGSVIGPAAYCGVYGYKASLDGLDRSGIRHCKPFIDTLGLFSRSIDDLMLLRAVSVGQPEGYSQRADAPRIGVCRTQYWDRAEPCMQVAIERAATLLTETGAPVEDVALPNEVTEAEPHFEVLTTWEAAKVLEREARDHLDTFNPWNRERMEFAQTLTEDRYVEAKQGLAAARASLVTLFDKVDVLLTPPRIGEAPIGIEGVRPSPFNAVWTQMYTPCVTLPLFKGPNGMPLGIQIVGVEHADDTTLANAAWIDRSLRAALGTVPARV
jgi:Asp-tRNA(Asn)/Glu-tRNA(Gln) amidotransferase A subunit family amidase